MSYTIKITKTQSVVRKGGKEWKPVSAAADAAYAYTPEIEREAQEEIEVLRQTVDDLDMAAVIKAVNKL